MTDSRCATRKVWEESGYDYSVLTEDNLYRLTDNIEKELPDLIKDWKKHDPNAWLELHYLNGKPFWCY